MIVDPLLKYAIEHEDVSKRLTDISMMPKNKWNLEEARNYYIELVQAANAGSGLAMCLCARFCRLGIGVKASGVSALEWGRKAADKDFAPGCFEVGYCYEHGVDVEADQKQALKFYTESATAGYGYGAAYLATKLHDGDLGAKNIKKAIMFARLGYEHGDATAPLVLGGWYENGDGIEKNESAAVMWYERASKLGSFLASERLHSAYLYGELGLVVNKITAKKYLDLFESQTEAIITNEVGSETG